MDSHTRKEVYRESDHDGVQIVLRGALIPKPEPRATLRPSTLGDSGVRTAISSLLAETTGLTTDTADTLWNRVLHVGLEHQRERAKARGARRQEILKKIKRLQGKLRGMPESRGYRRVTHTLNRYKGKLRLQIHKDRRQRDDLEEYTAQMVATGQGKQPKPWAPPQPVTRVQEPATCNVHAALKPTSQGGVHLTLSKRVTEGAVHTSQEDIATSVSAFWEGLLNAVHTPSEQAERDKAGVLGRLRAEVKSLPKSVTEGLKTSNLVSADNIIAPRTPALSRCRGAGTSSTQNS